jgi:hypothetical protein
MTTVPLPSPSPLSPSLLLRSPSLSLSPPSSIYFQTSSEYLFDWEDDESVSQEVPCLSPALRLSPSLDSR